MGRVKIIPFEAGAKLLARDRYSSIKHKSFLFDFMEYMSEDGWNLDTKEAQKIYEYFDGAIRRTLENGELELFERDEQPEEPASGSNVEPEDVLWIEDTWLAESSPLPNGARHFEKWSEEAKNNQSVPNFNIQMDKVKKAVEKRAKSIDFFMRDFDLSESEAETVYYYLTEKDANSKGKPPIDKNVKDVLDHIKELTDIVIDL